MRLLTLLVLTFLTTLSAVEAPLPPKLDTAYRTYLAALAKAYQTETAKFDAQLKREAASAKKGSEMADAVAALQTKIAGGGQMQDLSDLVTGGVLDAPRIVGGADALIGTWNLTCAEWAYYKSYTWEFKANGTVTATMLTNTSKTSRSMRWIVKDGVVSIPEENDVWSVKLPLPMPGNTTPFTVTRGGNLGETYCTLTRVDDVKPVKK